MLTVVCLAAFVWSSHTSPFIPCWRETALYQSGLLDCLLPICTLLFVREIRDKMQVVYKEITRDGGKSNVAKRNLIGGIWFQHVKNCLVFYAAQWLGMLRLGLDVIFMVGDRM